MSSNPEESDVKYVLTLSQPNKKVCLKRVNIKDLPPSALSRVIKCKPITTLQLGQQVGQQIKTKGDDVELTVVATPGNSSANDVDQIPAKRIKMDEAVANQYEEKTVSSEIVVQPDTYENEEVFDEEIEEEEDDEEEEMYEEQVYYSTSDKLIRNPRSSKNEDYDYVPPNSLKVKRTETDKRKVKPKLFRSEWLNIDIFRDWLDRDPTNPYKARCIACDSVMNAGKSELEKHAAGMKHSQALQRMQQAMMVEQLQEANEDTQLTDGSQEPMAQGVMFGDDLQSELYHLRVQQVDAMNRVATAIETLSTTAVNILEKMATTQETLVQAIQELQKK